MSLDLSKEKLRKILINLGIKARDKINVSSNILNIISSKKNELKPLEIIETIKEIVTRQGTILFPTFNWDFCKGNTFDYKKTKSLSGSLSNLALNKSEFKRSKNPIYSFAVFGKDKVKIINLKHQSCFGLNSPFGYLIKNKGKNLFIDLDYKKAFTFVHVAEQSVGVNYRYLKNFENFYIDKNRKKKKKLFKMYVRRNNKVKSTLINEKFDFILKKNKSIKTIKYGKIIFSLVDIKKAYQLMVKDIKNSGGIITPELKWYEKILF